MAKHVQLHQFTTKARIHANRPLVELRTNVTRPHGTRELPAALESGVEEY